MRIDSIELQFVVVTDEGKTFDGIQMKNCFFVKAKINDLALLDEVFLKTDSLSLMN